MTEQQYIDYFEALASKHKLIKHGLEGNVSFAYVSDPDELENFDNLLRAATSDIFMLLVGSDGTFHDNNSESYAQNVDLQLYILLRVGNELSVSDARDQSLPILLSILTRMRWDAKKQRIITDGVVHFRIDDVQYQKVGPMNGTWYGYTAWPRFTCPFRWDVNSGTWTDI